MERRGSINQYAHTGKSSVFTINLANGTTPFIIFHNQIEHQSCFYRLLMEPFPCINVELGFYRPNVEIFKTLHKDEKDHVFSGGLFSAPL